MSDISITNNVVNGLSQTRNLNQFQIPNQINNNQQPQIPVLNNGLQSVRQTDNTLALGFSENSTSDTNSIRTIGIA